MVLRRTPLRIPKIVRHVDHGSGPDAYVSCRAGPSPKRSARSNTKVVILKKGIRNQQRHLSIVRVLTFFPETEAIISRRPSGYSPAPGGDSGTQRSPECVSYRKPDEAANDSITVGAGHMSGPAFDCFLNIESTWPGHLV